MIVEVRLYGTLREYRPSSASGAPHQPFFLEPAPPADVDSLRRQLHIPDGLITAAAVNGEAVGLDTRLDDGDRVALFPPSAGG